MLKVKGRNDNADYSSTNGNPESVTNSESQQFQPKEGEYEVTVLQESDTQALGHQIAGHSRTGVLKHKLGYVLKPLQKEPLGTREVGFYTKVYGTKSGFTKNDNDPNPNITSTFTNSPDGDQLSSLNLTLQKYLPKFYGVVKILSDDPDSPGAPTWKYYIALEDLVEGFTKPCVIDVKIGAKTWDPSAPPKKVAHEKSKYTGTKEPLGLSLTGMQYYDLSAQKTHKMEKELGKTLVVSTFIETIYEFFNGAADPTIPNYIAKKLLPRLKEIQEYFQVQREFCFYSSSLLIGYDAQRFEGQKIGQQKQNYNWGGTGDDGDSADISTWLRVCMIDFAHVFPIDGDKPDSNYQFGLHNLIKICNILELGSATEIPSSSSDSE